MLKLLLDQLQYSDPQIRIETLYAMVMVMETEALDVLAQMLQTEQNPEVKVVVDWAIEQIETARQQGYSTRATMQKTYYPNIENNDPTQDLDKLSKLEEEMRQARLRAQTPKTNLAGTLGETALIGALSFAATGSGASHSPGRRSNLKPNRGLDQAQNAPARITGMVSCAAVYR